MPTVTITGADASIAIGTTAAASNVQQFEDDTYDVIEQTSEIGEFGDERNIVSFITLADGRTLKARGSADAGDMDITYAHKPGGDDGQDALLSAFNASQGADEFNFRVMLDDQITPSTGNPTTYYFRGKVVSNRLQAISPDGTVTRLARVAINTAILTVDAV